MWRRIRFGVLLLILFVVAGGTWSDRQRTTDWSSTLWVGVFPVNGDGRPATARYIAALEQDQYTDIEEFFAGEAAEYGVTIGQPVKMASEQAVTLRLPGVCPVQRPERSISKHRPVSVGQALSTPRPRS